MDECGRPIIYYVNIVNQLVSVFLKIFFTFKKLIKNNHHHFYIKDDV